MTQQQRTQKTAAVAAIAAAAAAAVLAAAALAVVVVAQNLVRSRNALSQHSDIAATSFCRAHSDLCLHTTA
jgi:hypothetical protein